MILSCQIFFGLIRLVKTWSEHCNPDIPKDQLWELDKALCQGKKLWPDGSDLKMCRKHDWKKCAQEKVRFSMNAGIGSFCAQASSRCNKTGGGGWPGQCVANDKLSNQEYSCLDRSDTGASRTSGANVDFSKMIKCQSMQKDGMNQSEPVDGFMCNGEFYEEGSQLTYWYGDEIHTIPWAALYKHFVIYTKNSLSTWCKEPCSDDHVEIGICRELNGTFYHDTCWQQNGTNTKPQYTDYTGIELQSAYLIFWMIMASQLLITMATKRIFSKQFRKSSVWGKLQHSLNILHIPDVFQEWDENCDDINRVQKRWKNSKLEMLVASLVHWATNTTLVLPAFLTGLNIIARHEIIVPAIGAYPDEFNAYHKAKIFLWLPPLMVTLASSADFLLFLLYNRFGHPWKDLLLKDEILDISDKNNDIPNENVAILAEKLEISDENVAIPAEKLDSDENVAIPAEKLDSDENLPFLLKN